MEFHGSSDFTVSFGDATTSKLRIGAQYCTSPRHHQDCFWDGLESGGAMAVLDENCDPETEWALISMNFAEPTMETQGQTQHDPAIEISSNFTFEAPTPATPFAYSKKKMRSCSLLPLHMTPEQILQ